MMKDMTVTQYMNAVAEAIGAKTNIVEKENGVIYHGVMKENGTNCLPTVYVDEFYARDISVSDAAKEIEEIIKANEMTKDFDLSYVDDYEKVKPMLRARLYNKATKAEIFRKATGFNDLIIIPVIELGDFKGDGSCGSIKVTEALLSIYGVTKKELIDTAIKNSSEDFTIQSMESVMMQMMLGMEIDPVEDVGVNPQMIVLSNRSKVCGAISAVTLKKRLQTIFPNGYCIIPSSIHEVIAVPYTPGCEDGLSEMVREVNVTEVAPNEILGSRAYIFAA